MAGNVGDLLRGGSDTGLLLLIAALAWYFKRQTKEYDDHIKKCDLVPKGQILTTLDNVCERMDEMRENVKSIATSQAMMGMQLSELIGRQKERDHH